MVPRAAEPEGPALLELVVILQAQVRDQIFASQMAQCILQLHHLNEQVVLGIKAWSGHG